MYNWNLKLRHDTFYLHAKNEIIWYKSVKICKKSICGKLKN